MRRSSRADAPTRVAVGSAKEGVCEGSVEVAGEVMVGIGCVWSGWGCVVCEGGGRGREVCVWFRRLCGGFEAGL